MKYRQSARLKYVHPIEGSIHCGHIIRKPFFCLSFESVIPWQYINKLKAYGWCVDHNHLYISRRTLVTVSCIQ